MEGVPVLQPELQPAAALRALHVRGRARAHEGQARGTPLPPGRGVFNAHLHAQGVGRLTHAIVMQRSVDELLSIF